MIRNRRCSGNNLFPTISLIVNDSISGTNTLGAIRFRGGDNQGYGTGAMIAAASTAGWSAGDYDYPTALWFYTQSDSSTSDLTVPNMVVDSTGNVGVGTTTPLANFQATNPAPNSTTSISFGKAGQNKGTCMTFRSTTGAAVYMYFAGASVTPTYTATKPAGCQD